ncbi:MAG: serine/threonine-protein kinase [Kofleriaceae bacterium]
MADPDELARTATAVSGAGSEPAKPVGNMLGRYRIEKTLGEGGMGVVHCAFDPDLERRVALKVLRRTDGGGDARQRLLREARAMARLTHENVVVVHEVGTAGDRDYVAMELIEGQTLADWLGDKGKPATIAEIVDAFIAAAKGLAAAHAAGLVHRDFKPHNVLRRADGKIVVTDFGLARGVENVEAVALDETMDPSRPKSDSSGLGGITKTGSVLGTPAYMAPEQWSGGVVGPAADQFAFCVALWEALTGERPFSGATLEELKTSVGKGSAALDASKLPRRLRKALIRGLDPDPKKRWPSMDALIAAIRRADRHVGLAFMLAGGAIVAGLVAFVAMHRGSSCDPPALDPQAVWKQEFGASMPKPMAEMYKRELGHWAIARATACTAEPTKRTIELHCLDGVLSRFDVARRAFTSVAGAKVDDVIDNLVDPGVCLRDVTPRLAYPHTPESIDALNLYARIHAAKDDDARKQFAPQATAFLAKPGLDACSKAVATFAKAKTLDDFNAERAMIEDAATQSEQCDDDRLHADLLIALVPYLAETPNIGPRGVEAMKRAAAAVERVKQPNLAARLDLYRVRALYEAGKQKESLQLIDEVATAFKASGQTYLAAMAVIGSFGIRMRLDKMTEVEQLITQWRPVVQSVGTEDDVPEDRSLGGAPALHERRGRRRPRGSRAVVAAGEGPRTTASVDRHRRRSRGQARGGCAGRDRHDPQYRYDRHPVAVHR